VYTLETVSSAYLKPSENKANRKKANRNQNNRNKPIVDIASHLRKRLGKAWLGFRCQFPLP